MTRTEQHSLLVVLIVTKVIEGSTKFQHRIIRIVKATLQYV